MIPDPRKIFGPYWNGTADVYADPLTVYRRLVSLTQGEPNALLKDARDPDPLKRAKAWEKLLPAAVAALDMVPFDPAAGAGAAEQDVRAALRAYLEYVRAKKASGPTRPTCSPCTAPQDWRAWQDDPGTAPTPTGLYPTISGSASGSTSRGNAGDGPGK